MHLVEYASNLFHPIQSSEIKVRTLDVQLRCYELVFHLVSPFLYSRNHERYWLELQEIGQNTRAAETAQVLNYQSLPLLRTCHERW